MRIVTFRVFVIRSQKRFFLGTFRLFQRTTRSLHDAREVTCGRRRERAVARRSHASCPSRLLPRVFRACEPPDARDHPSVTRWLSRQNRGSVAADRGSREETCTSQLLAPRGPAGVVASGLSGVDPAPERRAARAAPRRASRARQETQARPRSRSRTVRVDERGERANLFSLDGARRFVSQRNVVGRRVGRDQKKMARKTNQARGAPIRATSTKASRGSGGATRVWSGWSPRSRSRARARASPREARARLRAARKPLGAKPFLYRNDD